MPSSRTSSDASPSRGHRRDDTSVNDAVNSHTLERCSSVSVLAWREGMVSPKHGGIMGKHRTRRFVTLLLAMLVQPVSSAVAQTVQRLETEAPRLMEAAEIPGMSVAWIEDGHVAWTEAFGVRDAATGVPVTPMTIFEAASLSKPVVAYAVLRLVARGELDLDAPLWDAEGYERLAHDERARRITARMVLTHTTGLPNWGGTPLELDRDPGTAWGYSGEGFVFLASMVQRRTGVSLNELVAREVFEPLGMRRSSFVWQPAYDSTTAAPHDLLARAQTKRHPTGEGNAAASLHTTAGDYARFVSAVLAGEGLPSDLASEMLHPAVQVGRWGTKEPNPNLHWGLGWGLQAGDEHTAIWHWGDNGNFRCFVIAYPERGDGLVYFTNSNSGLAIAEELVSLAFQDTHWSIRWLDHWRWDNPQRIARIELRRAFVDGQVDDGWQRYAGWHAKFPEDVGATELGNLGNFLLNEGQTEVGLAVLERRAADFPSASAWIDLAEARTNLGAYEDALADYQRASSLDPDEAVDLEARLDWLRDGIEAAGSPVSFERMWGSTARDGSR